MTATAALRRLERVEALTRALVDPPAVPGAVDLFRATGQEPDPWQREVLASRAQRILMNCSRQSGKSTVAAAIAVHEALSLAGALVLLLSPSLRQSQELFRKVLDVYAAAGRPVLADTENRLTLELANGSRIVSLPGTERTVRGFSGVRLLLVDEASRVEDTHYQSIRPMLAVSGGRLVALSTPFGARGWWHAAWTSDEPWLRVEVPATACPRISPAFLAEERRSMGDLFYRSEYLCEFCDTEENAFSSEMIAAAIDSDLTPLWEVA
jgi:hypothetical protein